MRKPHSLVCRRCPVWIVCSQWNGAGCARGRVHRRPTMRMRPTSLRGHIDSSRVGARDTSMR